MNVRFFFKFGMRSIARLDEVFFGFGRVDVEVIIFRTGSCNFCFR